MSAGDRTGIGTREVHSFESWMVDPQNLRRGELLGSGAFANVYLGIRLDTDNTVALKVLKENAYDEAKDKEFKQEVATMVDLSCRHPNILNLWGICTNPRCIVLEYCARGSLYELIQNHSSHPQFTWPLRLKLAREIAQGMCFMHSRKFIHRDLKSPNVLLTEHWEARIADFGLAKFCKPDAATSSVRPSNPIWMDPDLLRSEKLRSDWSTDVYSFGIIMYELLMLELPCQEILDLNPDHGLIRLYYQIVNAHQDMRSFMTFSPERLPGGRTTPQLNTYIQLLAACTHPDSSLRPSFRQIVAQLKTVMGMQHDTASVLWASTSQAGSFLDGDMHALANCTQEGTVDVELQDVRVSPDGSLVGVGLRHAAEPVTIPVSPADEPLVRRWQSKGRNSKRVNFVLQESLCTASPFERHLQNTATAASSSAEHVRAAHPATPASLGAAPHGRQSQQQLQSLTFIKLRTELGKTQLTASNKDAVDSPSQASGIPPAPTVSGMVTQRRSPPPDAASRKYTEPTSPSLRQMMSDTRGRQLVDTSSCTVISPFEHAIRAHDSAAGNGVTALPASSSSQMTDSPTRGNLPAVKTGAHNVSTAAQQGPAPRRSTGLGFAFSNAWTYQTPNPSPMCEDSCRADSNAAAAVQLGNGLSHGGSLSSYDSMPSFLRRPPLQSQQGSLSSQPSPATSSKTSGASVDMEGSAGSTEKRIRQMLTTFFVGTRSTIRSRLAKSIPRAAMMVNKINKVYTTVSRMQSGDATMTPLTDEDKKLLEEAYDLQMMTQQPTPQQLVQRLCHLWDGKLQEEDVAHVCRVVDIDDNGLLSKDEYLLLALVLRHVFNSNGSIPHRISPSHVEVLLGSAGQEGRRVEASRLSSHTVDTSDESSSWSQYGDQGASTAGDPRIGRASTGLLAGDHEERRGVSLGTEPSGGASAVITTGGNNRQSERGLPRSVRDGTRMAQFTFSEVALGNVPHHCDENEDPSVFEFHKRNGLSRRGSLDGNGMHSSKTSGASVSSRKTSTAEGTVAVGWGGALEGTVARERVVRSSTDDQQLFPLESFEVEPSSDSGRSTRVRLSSCSVLPDPALPRSANSSRKSLNSQDSSSSLLPDPSPRRSPNSPHKLVNSQDLPNRQSNGHTGAVGDVASHSADPVNGESMFPPVDYSVSQGDEDGSLARPNMPIFDSGIASFPSGERLEDVLGKDRWDGNFLGTGSMWPSSPAAMSPRVSVSIASWRVSGGVLGKEPYLELLLCNRNASDEVFADTQGLVRLQYDGRHTVHELKQNIELKMPSTNLSSDAFLVFLIRNGKQHGPPHAGLWTTSKSLHHYITTAHKSQSSTATCSLPLFELPATVNPQGWLISPASARSKALSPRDESLTVTFTILPQDKRMLI